ncbi:hypothetical protein NUSPORA_00484 [Nucleospora cyclopteri]
MFLTRPKHVIGNKSICPYCKTSMKTVDHLDTKCDRLVAFDYTRRHNGTIRYIYFIICLRYGLKLFKKIRIHFVQELVVNED